MNAPFSIRVLYGGAAAPCAASWPRSFIDSDPSPRPYTARKGCPTRRNQAGVTLIELLIVTALIALVAGMAFPSAAAGVESLRLRSTAESMVSFLNSAIDRAQRRQQVIELWISPQENLLIARSPDLGYSRRLELPGSFRISAIQPALPPEQSQLNPPRRFLMYPGGTVPRIAVEIASANGRKRTVAVDPFTGQPAIVEPRVVQDAQSNSNVRRGVVELK